MMIALFPNTVKEKARTIAFSIKEYLANKGIELVTTDESSSYLEVPSISKVDPTKIDFVISLGGDGTILRLVQKYPDIHAPLLGINVGQLGFMADVRVDDIYPSLQDLINGEYQIEKRVMLQGWIHQEEAKFAINDIIIHRGQNPNLIDLGIHVNGQYLNTFSADGVIFSTPTGSTAYSLAAGGPILTPELEALVLTPICPHTISNRPIVLSLDERLQVQYLSNHSPIEAMFDGIAKITIEPGEVFYVEKHKRYFNIVRLLRTDYFSTLRTKLGWSGKLR